MSWSHGSSSWQAVRPGHLLPGRGSVDQDAIVLAAELIAVGGRRGAVPGREEADEDLGGFDRDCHADRLDDRLVIGSHVSLEEHRQYSNRRRLWRSLEWVRDKGEIKV